MQVFLTRAEKTKAKRISKQDKTVSSAKRLSFEDYVEVFSKIFAPKHFFFQSDVTAELMPPGPQRVHRVNLAANLQKVVLYERNWE